MNKEFTVREDFLDVSIPEAQNNQMHYCMFLKVTESENKYGVSYDVNWWCSAEKTVCYKTLLGNEWDKLYVLEWKPFGCENILIAESNNKKCAFYLSCNYDYGTDKIEIIIKKLCPCIYDKIEYGFECEDILLLYKDNKVSFYDLDKNYLSVAYDKIDESEICNTVLILHDSDIMHFYALKKGTLSEAYTYISCIDNNFIECYNDRDSKIVNIFGETPFPEISFEDYNVEYQCNYKDGIVYRVGKRYTNEGEPWWTSYLVFYSKKSDRFYITETFEQIKVHATAPEHRIFYISGIECLKDGVWSVYQEQSYVGCDEGIKNLPIIKK